MSLTVYCKTSINNEEVLRRMCEEQGWGEPETVRHRPGQLQVGFQKGPQYGRNVFWVDLKTGQVAFDGDYARSFADKLDPEQKFRAGSQKERFEQLVDAAYRQADTILAAEKKGWEWEKEITEDGIARTRVTVPDDDELEEVDLSE